MSKYETAAGYITKGECFSKMLYLIDELRDQCCIMSHLYNTEDDNRSKLLAKGWLGINEMLQLLRHQIVEMAKKKLQ